MDTRQSSGSWTNIPPLIFLGAVAVLFPIVAFMTMENIHRYQENSVKMLKEKGAALIRSFEAGTRTGMMGLKWNSRHLQRLLTETARQPDVDYILVTNQDGVVLAHNDEEKLGGIHKPSGIDYTRLNRSGAVFGYAVQKNNGKRIYEVAGRFCPIGTRVTKNQYRILFDGASMLHLYRQKQEPIPLLIYVGLDMLPIVQATKAEISKAVLMGVILLITGLAGIMLVFLLQSYRAARTTLSRVKAFSDNVVNNMPMGLFATDANIELVSFNHVAGKILSILPEEAIGKNVHEIIPEDLLTLLGHPDMHESILEKEIDCRLKNGETIPLEVGAAILDDGKGRFMGYVVIFKDLTEVRYLRKEILRSQRLASVGSLAAGVAHEIRNPLSSLKGFATYFRDKYAYCTEDLEIAQIMIQEVERLNRVVSQLLEFARPIDISGQKFEVKKLVEESVKLVENQAQNADIRINTHMPENDLTIYGDKDRLNQVLLNLFLNAMEAMGEGGEIRVWVEENHDVVKIHVSDTGHGIHEGDLLRIFDPYFTTKPGGTGLGLAIIHNIMEAHGGQISIESRPEKGTTVTLILPEKDKSHQENSQTKEEKEIILAS